MTREEFDNISCLDELIDFAWDNDLYEVFDDIISAESRDEWINDSLVDWARDHTWDEMLTILSDLDRESGYDWYRSDDYSGEYHGIDNSDYPDMRRELYEYIEENGLWEDSQETGEDASPPVEDVGTTEEEDDDFADMVSLCEEGFGVMDVLSEWLDAIRVPEAETSGSSYMNLDKFLRG